LYQTRASLSVYPEGDGVAFAFRQRNRILVAGFDEKSEKYSPIQDMQGAPFDGAIISALTSSRVSSPTPIQAQSWPVIAAGTDAICVSRTGEGKTFAYAAPLLNSLLAIKAASSAPASGKGLSPKLLVLAPRRQLASEIAAELDKLAKPCGLSTVVATGAVEKAGLISKLKTSGADIVVATPGRCHDLIDSGALDVSDVKQLVLDEAHILLNLIMRPATRNVLKSLNKEGLQTVAVGARWPQFARDMEDRLFRRSRVLVHVLRARKDMYGEPSLSALKKAGPSERQRMVRRMKEREAKKKAAATQVQ
jgi:ATP-dependent RNA helicase DBP3